MYTAPVVVYAQIGVCSQVHPRSIFPSLTRQRKADVSPVVARILVPTAVLAQGTVAHRALGVLIDWSKVFVTGVVLDAHERENVALHGVEDHLVDANLYRCVRWHARAREEHPAERADRRARFLAATWTLHFDLALQRT